MIVANDLLIKRRPACGAGAEFRRHRRCASAGTSRHAGLLRQIIDRPLARQKPIFSFIAVPRSQRPLHRCQPNVAIGAAAANRGRRFHSKDRGRRIRAPPSSRPARQGRKPARTAARRPRSQQWGFAAWLQLLGPRPACMSTTHRMIALRSHLLMTSGCPVWLVRFLSNTGIRLPKNHLARMFVLGLPDHRRTGSHCQSLAAPA